MAGGSASKAKGNRGERIICDFMGKIFGGNFMRVPNSGAMVGGSNAFRKQIMSEGQVKLLKGDIIPPDHMPKLIIESKNYKEFSWWQLLQDKPNANLEEWIEQEETAADDGDFLLIVFKITRKGTYVCFEEDMSEGMDIKNHSVYHCHYNQKRYIITEFEPFIEANKDRILELSK